MATATQTFKNFIDGESVDAAEGATDAVLNPATGEEIAQAPSSTQEDVERAVKAARAAFEGGWGTTTPGERALAILKLADALEERADEIAELESANAGKPIEAFKGDEVPAMVDNLRFFAGAARCMEGKAAGEYLEGYTSMIRREPVGVIGQIAPWNYPIMMAVWKIGPALATGNTIVLKPAPTTPLSTIRLAEIASEFLPKGVLNVIAGGNDPGAALVEHEDVDMVSLTGSVETGKWIAEHAARTLKKVHLELGGKAPVVVFDDVDLDSVLETIAGTGYYNAGQDCTAATRVLASSAILDDVVNGLAKEADGYVMGDTQLARHDARAAELGPPARARRGLPRAPALARRDRHRRQGARPARLLPAADRRHRPAAGRRDDPEARSSARSSPCSRSPTRSRRSSGPTARPTASPRRCGRATSAAPCASPMRCASAACGSTTTSRWPARCPTAAMASRATARTCRCTPSRTTRRSSTSWRR